MKGKLAAALLVGLLVGILIGGLLPVQAGAHHQVNRTRATLVRRVARLERQTRHLSIKGALSPNHVVSTCASGNQAI